MVSRSPSAPYLGGGFTIYFRYLRMAKTIGSHRRSIGPARLILGAAAVIGLLAASLWLTSTQVSAQPPFPIVYSGRAFIGGEPAPNGTMITGRIGSAESRPVEVRNGRYLLLVVDPSLEFDHSEDVAGLVITFFADGVRAVETEIYLEGTFIEKELDLHFPELPLTGDNTLGLLWPIAAGLGALSLAAGVGILVWQPRRRRMG